ncbi:MAG TPA: hypothetical protein VME47_22565 [Acetobacteraceae bacterium]|nr:hypothetical protein [Acetobacteraceae bacterium]
MILDAPHPKIQFADQYAMPKDRGVILGHRLPQRRLAVHEIVQLAVMRVQQQRVFIQHNALLGYLARQMVDGGGVFVELVAMFVERLGMFLENTRMLIQDTSMLIQDARMLIQDASMLIQDARMLIQDARMLIQDARMLIQRQCMLIQRQRMLVGDPLDVINGLRHSKQQLIHGSDIDPIPSVAHPKVST